MARDRTWSIEAYGVPVDVEVRHVCSPGACGQSGLSPMVADRLPPGWVDRSGARRPVGLVRAVCHGDHLVVTDGDGHSDVFEQPASALHALDGSVRTLVAVHAPGLVFIHAGVVAFDGRVIVMPGRSFAGKTTLVAALLGSGATYLSDEYAPIDADGLVHPYPRRLSLRVDGGRREVSASEMGGSTAMGPLPVGLVAAIRFRAGASWQVTDADQAACAEALLDNAVAARIRPAEVLATSARVARSARFLTGVRGEAADAAQHLQDLLVSRAG